MLKTNDAVLSINFHNYLSLIGCLILSTNESTPKFAIRIILKSIASSYNDANVCVFILNEHRARGDFLHSVDFPNHSSDYSGK